MQRCVNSKQIKKTSLDAPACTSYIYNFVKFSHKSSKKLYIYNWDRNRNRKRKISELWILSSVVGSIIACYVMGLNLLELYASPPIAWLGRRKPGTVA